MTIKDFIRKNREDIDIAIRSACPNIRHIDDDERYIWICNDEGLYNWAISSGVNL